MPKILDLLPDDFESEVSLSQGGLKKTFKLTFVVLANTLLQTEEDILGTPGLPYIGMPLRGCYCVKRAAKEQASQALLWHVQCAFDSHVDVTLFERDGRPPEQWPPEWDWDSESIEEVVEVDQETGEPIVNTAGEPLIVTRPVAMPVLTIRRYERSFDPDVIVQWGNRVNSEPFWGAPENCALLLPPKDQPATVTDQNGVTLRLRQVTYTVKFNFSRDRDGELSGWLARPLNHGTRYVAFGAEVAGFPTQIYEPFLDAHGNPTTGNLDEEGGPLANDAEEIYLSFHRYKKANLNALSLGPYE